MFAAAEGVYEYGLPAVWPLTTPGVGVGEDIVKSTESLNSGQSMGRLKWKIEDSGAALYIKHRRTFCFPVGQGRSPFPIWVSSERLSFTTHEVICGQIEKRKSPITLARQRPPCSATRFLIDRPDCAHLFGRMCCIL